MRHFLIFILIVVAVQLGGEYQKTRIEAKVHEYINQEREAAGVSPLLYDDTLAETARQHSKYMQETGDFKHSSTYCRGENILTTGGLFYGIIPIPIHSVRTLIPAWEARDIVDSWMSSPGHRENILRPSFTSEGIGITINTFSRTLLVTQNFC